ncbi:hypothetical protein ACIP2Y_30630 [Streptomyces sviceus]|uniref:hypothetical protein n=1 Tax=Streptomyces sviceus TaxID=285530 RepID=UPI003823F084
MTRPAVVQDIILGNDPTRYVARVHTRPLYVAAQAPSVSVVRAREVARPKPGTASGERLTQVTAQPGCRNRPAAGHESKQHSNRN